MARDASDCWLCSAHKDLPSLARFLTRLGSDRPVIDQTGLAGAFDIDMDISNALEGGDGPPTNLGMFEAVAGALERVLGLRLAPAKAPVEVLVVERVERPRKTKPCGTITRDAALCSRRYWQQFDSNGGGRCG